MGRGRARSSEQDRSEFLSFVSIVLLTSYVSLAESFHIFHISRPISLHIDVNKNT